MEWVLVPQSRLYTQHCQVMFRANADQRRIKGAIISQSDLGTAGALDNMVVGNDMAFGIP
tara:strand:- start:16789 stop:16968 length:180 start_codon:yes stop_codon:yes gene_type:complete